METIPTLLCTNANYAQHATVCIVSLLENNKDYFFGITIVATTPLGVAAEKLQQSVSAYKNCDVRIIELNTSALELPVRAQHYTIDTYSRLWVAEFFAETVDKILYLDSDMIVVGAIDPLWNMDLGEQVLAAVTIPGSTRCSVYGIPEDFGYFQSGVLLIDLAKWRKDRIFEQLLAWIEKNGALIQDADQDVLNACLYNRRLPLDYIWNVIVPFYFDYHPLGISEVERGLVRRDARIIHFNGPSKPWHYLNRHPRRADYWKYLRKTEWRDYRPDDLTLVNRGKKHFAWMVPAGLRSYLKARLSL